MGVDYTARVMYGVKMKGDLLDWYEVALEEAEGAPNAKFDLCVDNMMGEYAVAGRSIASGSKWDTGFEIIDDKIEATTDDNLALVKNINEKLGTNFTLLDFHYYSFVAAS